MSALFSGHTSKEYSSIGTHLLFIRCKNTSSEASLPVLLNSAFTDRKNVLGLFGLNPGICLLRLHI